MLRKGKEENNQSRHWREKENEEREEEAMSIRQNKYPIPDLIKPKHILVSVFDKAGLEELVAGILGVNLDAIFYSTGGTGKEIIKILGDRAAKNYMSVEDFTGAPEMEGGLVKTLHPKIHAGLLAERGNPAHEEYFEILGAPKHGGNGIPGDYFDIFVGNLYPFSDAVDPKKTKDTNPEVARINIDIGGPAMTMASAKNWHSLATLTSPNQYSGFVSTLKANGGTTLEMRFALMQAATKLIGDYRSVIGNHFAGLDFGYDVKPTLNIV